MIKMVEQKPVELIFTKVPGNEEVKILLDRMLQDLAIQTAKKENELLKQVAEVVLGRKFEKPDAERFIIVYRESDRTQYELYFDERIIGKVNKVVEGNFYNIIFVPVQGVFWG